MIAGAGHAAGQAVVSLRQKKFDGNLILIGDEPYLPYQRPPLSKTYLAGEIEASRLLVKPAAFYEDGGMRVMLDSRITRITPAEKTVHIQSGESIAYDKLILSVGSRARTITLPGTELPGVHYLRGIHDVNTLRSELAPGKRLVILGAGYIGLEVAAICTKLGLQVTVVDIADRVLSRVVSPPVSAFFQQLHTGHGVRFRMSCMPTAFCGDDGIEAVEFSDGTTQPADLVLVAAGIVPNVELAEAAGLQVDNGIVVNERCQSSDRHIYAIGDCSSHPNGIYGRRIRLESVHNALEQAKTAVNNLCGIDDDYSQVPWFWSDQYDVKLQIAGLSQGYDATVIRGEQSSARFACFYLRKERLIAVDAINSPREFMRSKALIASLDTVDPRILADPDQDVTAARR